MNAEYHAAVEKLRTGEDFTWTAPPRLAAEALNEALNDVRAERDRLRSAFEALLEEAVDMRAYVPEYFAKKWHYDEALAAAREALSSSAGDQP